jgi:hypothetical protein
MPTLLTGRLAGVMSRRSNSLQQHQTCWGLVYKELRRQSCASD